MLHNRIIAVVICVFFLTPGCLESLEDDLDPNKFWGEDCDEVSDELCKAGPAPDFELVDQYNNTVNMSQFKGKIVVITFIFTNCPDICPAITYQMNKIAEELGPNFNESVVFLTVTVDPERDTPERLKAFASDYGASWQFLTSDAEYPVGVMSPIWQDYGIYVDIDEDACSGNGHYMEGYEGCHCNPGYIQDPWNVDSCIDDPDYDNNATFDEGTIESDIIAALDLWASGIVNASQFMRGTTYLDESVPGFRELISHLTPEDWKLEDVSGTEHSSSTYYKQNLTLIEFFHTKCGHCQSQIPALKEFQANHSSNVSIVSVGGYGMGGNQDNLSTIENFTMDYNASWTYLYDDSHSLMKTFGFNGYPSWVLLDGDQVVGRETGKLSYDQLETFIQNRSERVTLSSQMVEILDYLVHWDQGHVSDDDMVEIIAGSLNYDYNSNEETIDNYGVSHSSKLYIIDQEGNMRVVWRSSDWTYASVYHDIALLL